MPGIAAPVTIAGSPIFGKQASHMVLHATRRGLTSPVWVPKYALPLLGVEPSGPGIVGDQKYLFYNAQETSNPAIFVDGMAYEQQIPLSARGNIMPHGPFERMQRAMREHGLTSPYWTTLRHLEELGASALPGAIAINGGLGDDVSSLLHFNASQTSKPELFTNKTCINYVPRLVPSRSSRALLPRAIRQKLLDAAVQHGYISQLWVEKESMEAYGFTTLKPGLAPLDDLAVTLVQLDGSSIGHFVNGDCFDDQARVGFFESYRPITMRGTPIGDWPILTACAFELKLKSEIWVSLEDITDGRVSVEIRDDAQAVAVQLRDVTKEFVNAEQTTKPREIVRAKLSFTGRRSYNFSQ